MEWLQTLLDGGTAPVLTAMILGLMTAISPCPLATNVAAMGYIAKDLEQPRRALSRGILYCFGRMLSYTALGIGHCIDQYHKRRQQRVRGSKLCCKLGRETDRTSDAACGTFHAIRASPQTEGLRLQWRRQPYRVKRRMESTCPRGFVCNGILPYQCRVLLRDADSDECHRFVRLASPCCLCHRYGIAGRDCCVDILIQRWQHRQVLQQNGSIPEVDEPHCRHPVHRSRIILFNHYLIITL